MIDTDDPDEVIARSGRVATAVTATTADVGRITDDMVLHHTGGSALDRALVRKLTWVQQTFQNAVRNADGQAQLTQEATVVGVTALRNADIDGGTTVRNVEV